MNCPIFVLVQVVITPFLSPFTASLCQSGLVIEGGFTLCFFTPDMIQKEVMEKCAEYHSPVLF